ncbi:hypothetical protein CK203_092072 [Vitis vinifera]|uniref:Uncharacterized protein n=2 Tax=Vitis vinifera TaxID=29760 RepID=A0A438CLC8_VITVI|nr:hypothetical protein CK203_092072 [Vitis vinifera]
MFCAYNESVCLNFQFSNSLEFKLLGIILYLRRPTALQDRTRDSDDDDYQDRDYDVAALANNLSQAFRYGIYSNDDMDETHGQLERDDESTALMFISHCFDTKTSIVSNEIASYGDSWQDVYFDDESAEVVISSLRLGDDQESSSLFTNSNWFAFEDDRIANERSTGSLASPSPNTETGLTNSGGNDEVIVGEDDELDDTATSSPLPEVKPHESTQNNPSDDLKEIGPDESDKPPEWVEWRETSDSSNPSDVDKPLVLPNGELQSGHESNEIVPDTTEPSPSVIDELVNNGNAAGALPESMEADPSSNLPKLSESSGDENMNLDPTTSQDVEMADGTEGTPVATEHEKRDMAEEVGN